MKFEQLTKAEQRVVIAKDLLVRLKAKKFIAQQGTYLRATLTLKEQSNDGAEVRDVLKNNLCRGCQIGGMFLCAVDRHNKLRLTDIGGFLGDDAPMRSYLRRWFSKKQLEEVEDAFEGYGDYFDWEVADADERMTQIAKNIIRNGGRFNGRRLLNGA